MTFIRIYVAEQRKEVLVNVAHISKIDVTYAVLPSESKNYYRVNLEQGLTDPEARRFFTFSVNGEEFFLGADPNDPVMRVFDDIYKNALKG